MNAQQAQQLAMAQQMAAQYGAGGRGGGVGGGGAAVPGQAPYAAAAPAASSNGTTITVSFPDGCLLGYDRLRNEMIVNGKVSNTRMNNIPARPRVGGGGGANGSGDGFAVQEVAVPVEKTGMMTKLGWKKDVMGFDSWQPRYFRLTDSSLSYHVDPSSPPKNTIALNAGIVVNVVSADTAARKNR